MSIHQFLPIKTHIVMGQGTVITGSAAAPDGSFGLLMFNRTNGETGVPGQFIGQYPGINSAGDCDVVIEFTTVRSIDQMINNLNNIREMMIGAEK